MGVCYLRFLASKLQNNIVYGILAGAGTCAFIYGVYKLIKCIYEEDEYFNRVSWHGGVAQRRILVLGLDGAGKTRLLQCFQRGLKPGDIMPEPEPTIAFNIRSAGIAGIDYHFWDVKGEVTNRTKWCQLLHNIDVLLWVVDSSNPARFRESRDALHEFMGVIDEQEDEQKSDADEQCSNYGIPVVIVATKQDHPKSLPPSEVYDQIAPQVFTHKHKVYLIGTEIPNVGQRKGLWRVYELISFATRKRYQQGDQGISHI